MMGPDVRDERLMELRNRGLQVRPRVPWRSNGVVLSIVFFALTSIGILALYGFLYQIKLTWLTGILSIALAEFLIHGRRFFGTGVESALWLGGLFALIFELPGPPREEGLLLFAAAAALAGWRMRNGFFGALAALFVMRYTAARGDETVAASVAVVLSLAALAALGREWGRPSTERLWIALLIIPPVSLLIDVPRLLPWWAALMGGMAIGSLAAGLRIRTHAPLIASAVYLALSTAILAAHDLLPLTVEWRLITGGALLLAASAALARLLRDRTGGIVTMPATSAPFEEAAQIVGTLALQPRVAQAPQEPGGRFGGAGATGEF
ncbi:MAG TPA: hypothetical protein VNA04_10260 [Thermoanaerobaculia bacterium]|nr:hypothetical protein [Thermoanaerobaculia bacterium]